MNNLSEYIKKGTDKDKNPIWVMRQAGRYLPEYRKLREGCPDFIEFCLTPDLCIEATLQPLRRFDLSSAIIFSDILTIPLALGQKVWFEGGVGPRLEPIDRESLLWDTDLSILSRVYDAVKGVRASLPKEKSLIGFTGAPFTLACYMFEGRGSRDFPKVKQWAYRHPKEMTFFLMKLAEVCANHLLKQIEAGCDVVQIFESWAGCVADAYVEPWLIGPVKHMVSILKEKAPHIPIIAFPKDLNGWLPHYCRETKVDAISLSHHEKLDDILPKLPASVVTQGALDPQLLVAGGEALASEITRQKQIFSGRKHIFNLGHGIVPETPVENLQAYVEQVIRK